MNNNFKKLSENDIHTLSGGANTVGAGGGSGSSTYDPKMCGAYAWGLAGQVTGFGCGDAAIYADNVSKYCK